MRCKKYWHPPSYHHRFCHKYSSRQFCTAELVHKDALTFILLVHFYFAAFLWAYGGFGGIVTVLFLTFKAISKFRPNLVAHLWSKRQNVKRRGVSRLLGGASAPRGVPVIAHSGSEALLLWVWACILSTSWALTFLCVISPPPPICWYRRDGFSTS